MDNLHRTARRTRISWGAQPGLRLRFLPARAGSASARGTLTRWLLPVCMSLALAACATNTIKPSYETSNPDIQVGGPRPDDGQAHIENAGSFCLEVTEKWHQDGKTPDGKALWARDTYRKVVPCS